MVNNNSLFFPGAPEVLRIQCFRDLLVERTCHLILLSEFLGHLFQHFPDWKMVWTSGFAFAAAYAGGCFYPKATVAVPCPICKVVAFQIACEKEGTWNADSYCTWRTVIAAAAEIGAKLMADFFHLGKLLLSKGRSVCARLNVLF